MIDAETARRLLSYDPETGVLTFKARPVARPQDKSWNTRFAGKRTGCRVFCPSAQGYYLQVSVLGKLYLAHRLAWLIVHGEWPPADIDHKDGDGTNNRLTNLRPASRAQNNQNMGVSCRNTSGFPGASRTKSGRWRAQIAVNGRLLSLGTFDTAEEAGRAYQFAKARLHTFAPEVRSNASSP